MKNFNEKYTVRDFIDKNKWSNVYECINNETNEVFLGGFLMYLGVHLKRLLRNYCGNIIHLKML